jgi:hypothetical protein
MRIIHAVVPGPVLLASLPLSLWLAGCGELNEPAADEPVEVQTAPATTGDSCSKSEGNDGTTVKFKTHLSCSSGDTQCKSDALSLEEQVIFGPDGQTDVTTIKRKGASLIHTETQSSEGGEDVAITYSAPITGIRQSFGFTDGDVMSATIDGRDTLQMDVSTPPDQMGFLDGRPAPKVGYPGNLKKEIANLLKAARPQARACIEKQLGGKTSSAAELAAAGVEGHPSDTFTNLKCQGCRGTCHAGAVYCAYGIAGSSAACGPFAVLCVAAGLAGCTGAQILCLKGCHSSGSFCCPVACGGEGKPFYFAPSPRTPFVGCCKGGETCLDRGPGLCCSSGFPPCGKTCCGGGNVCLGSGSNATCCAAGEVCGPFCCGAGHKCARSGNNFSCLDACTRDDECGFGGRCVNGGCFPG